MPKKHSHLREHAKRHHQRHETLKELLGRYNPKKEKIGALFAVTFLIALTVFLGIRNWGMITEKWSEVARKPKTDIEIIRKQVGFAGFHTGVQSTAKLAEQLSFQHRERINRLITFGGTIAAQNNLAVGQKRDIEVLSADFGKQPEIWLTSYISTGQHLTRLSQQRVRALQKSILSTYFLGGKALDIGDTIAQDTRLLQQIQNTLSTDLFQYLNQADNRADGLNEYLRLLTVVRKNTEERLFDLSAKITFLTANAASVETELTISEGQFFENLNALRGEQAESSLREFIGVREGQAEIRAKLGAYQTLKGYYEFLKPQLENLSRAINANRDALVAGVRVVEIENMTLPLIIREQ